MLVEPYRSILLILLLYLVHSFPVLIIVVHELCRIHPQLQLTGWKWNHTTENTLS